MIAPAEPAIVTPNMKGMLKNIMTLRLCHDLLICACDTPELFYLFFLNYTQILENLCVITVSLFPLPPFFGITAILTDGFGEHDH